MRTGAASLNDLAARHALARSERAIAQAVERLSTGKRINRAADDPAGLIAANALGARRKALDEEIKRAEFASHYLGAAEGGLSVIGDLLQELNSLAVSSANAGGLSEAEREANQTQADAILHAITHVTNTTWFNGRRVLTDSQGLELGGTVHVGPTLDLARLGWQVIETPGGEPDAGAEDPPEPTSAVRTLFDVGAGGALNLASGDTEGAQRVIKAALETVGGLRASIGATLQHALGTSLAAKRIEVERTAEAQSLIEDADFAQEVSSLLRGEILREAGLRVLDAVRGAAAQTTLALLG